MLADTVRIQTPDPSSSQLEASTTPLSLSAYFFEAAYSMNKVNIKSQDLKSYSRALQV